MSAPSPKAQDGGQRHPVTKVRQSTGPQVVDEEPEEPMDVQKTASSSTSDLHACKGVQLQRYLRERKSESALRWYSGCQSTINHPSSLRDDMIKAQTNKTGKINVEDIAREA